MVVKLSADGNRADLGFFFLGNCNGQDPILVIGLDPVTVRAVRQRKGTGERATEAFRPMIGEAVSLRFRLPLAFDRKNFTLEFQVNGFFIYSRNFCPQNEIAILFQYVYGWPPVFASR